MSRKLLFLMAALAAFGCLMSDGASAQQRCRIMDPTGTPLNVRSEPNGPVVATIKNGVLVSVVSQTEDRGKAWVFINDFADNRPIGWVFREFISCF